MIKVLLSVELAAAPMESFPERSAVRLICRQRQAGFGISPDP